MSLRRYITYRSSGVDWLGNVPDHWAILRIRYLASRISSGKTPLGGNETYTDSGVIFLRSQNIHDQGLRLDDVVYISDAVDTTMAVSRVQPNDILVNITGASIGRSCVVPNTFPHANVNQHVCVIRMIDESHVNFVGWCFKSAGTKAQIACTQNGAARDGLNFSQIADLRIAFPPKEEHGAIELFLNKETSKIDALIAEQQILIEILKEKRRAVITHAVTKGLNTCVPMKDSRIDWLDEVPEHWKVVSLGTQFREIAESGSEDLPVLSVSIHSGVSDREFDDDEVERKVTRSEDRTKYKRVQPGDLVYNMMRAWQGGFGTVAVLGMVSPAYVVARPTFQIQTNFIEQLLRTPHAIEELRRHSHGVTDFRPRLYWDEFKSIKVALPPFDEQSQIMDYCNGESAKFDALTAEAQSAITLLHERRTALISAAVTGKIDVRGLVKPETEAAA